MIRWKFAAALAAGLFAAASAQAQEWPRQPVRMIVGVAAGGGVDTLGRLVATKLSAYFGQQFVVENRPGAGGVIGADLVSRAPADGHTLLVSGFAVFVISPALSERKLFDPVNDFTHIATLGGPPFALVVAKNTPANSLKEFIDYAKAKPGEVAYGLPGIGSHAQLVAELFQQKTGIKLIATPYAGSSQAMIDLVGGHIPSTVTTLTSAADQIAAGTVRGLAISTPARLADYANIPTFAELGYPDLTSGTWFSLEGPPKMPADIVEKLNAGVRRAVQEPDVKARLQRDAITPELMTQPQFAAFVKSEVEKWTPFAKATGVKLE